MGPLAAPSFRIVMRRSLRANSTRNSIMDLRKAAIVVAHPDDEVLWFSSLTAKVGRIVMCYGSNPRAVERGRQRRKVVQAYPFNTVRFLDLPEPDLWRARSLESVEKELARSVQEDPIYRKLLIAVL